MKNGYLNNYGEILMKQFKPMKILQIASNTVGVRMIETELEGTFLSVKLIEYRKKRKMNQLDVVNALGEHLVFIRRSIISNWETGRSVPGLKTFVALCEIYKVTPNDLLGFYHEKTCR